MHGQAIRGLAVRSALVAACLMLAAAPAVAQLAEEILIRYDIRRTVNGTYRGLAYGESRIFVSPEHDGAAGTIYQYRLEELSRDGRLNARRVSGRASSSFEYRHPGDHFGERFVTPHSERFGALYVPPEDGVLVFQNFPVVPPEPLREGLVWQAPAAYLVDPQGSGRSTRIPILVEYRAIGRAEYLGRPVWAVETRGGLRYPGDDPYGDPRIEGARGSHASVVFYAAAPGLDEQRPVFIRTQVDEHYTMTDGGSIRQQGFILTFFTNPLPYGLRLRVAGAELTPGDPGMPPVGPGKPERPARVEPREPDVIAVQDPPAAAQNGSGAAQLREADDPGRISDSPFTVQRPDRAAELREILEETRTGDVEVARVPEGYALEIRNLLFLADQAVLLPAERYRLDSIAGLLKRFPDRQLLVTGHTADVGNPAGQMALSVERARAIVSELTRRGIETRRLMYEGKGGLEPVADNSTEEGRGLNRRVEITIIDP